MQLTFYQPLLWLLAILLLVVGYRLTLVDRPAKLMLASFLLRVVGVVLLVLSMCRPVLTSENENVHVIFLIDVSESVDLDGVRTAVEQMESGMASLNRGDTHGLFVFANGIRAFDKVEDVSEMLDQWSEGIADDQFRSASRLGDALLSTRLFFSRG